AKTRSHNDEHKTCTFTQTSSQTTTIFTCVSNLATPTYKAPPDEISAYNRISRHYNSVRKDKHNKTITVTFTPTTTLCPTPTSTCCQVPGGQGWQNEFHTPTNITILNNITNSQDCCKFCLNDLECVQWAFPNQCINYNTTDTCGGAIVNSNGFFDSGIIRCNDN
ncbi:14405_t:CDS:2, partial [Dentiscutata erythropus]